MRHLSVIAGFLAVVLPGVALADTAVVPGQPLWGGIETGMSKGEVKALYPTMRVQLSDGCVARISPSYEDGGVASIELARDSQSTSNSCAGVMAVSLATKYGEPRSDRNYVQFARMACSTRLCRTVRDIALDIDPDPNVYRHETRWFTGDTLVILDRDRESDDWSIVYYQAYRAHPDAADRL